MAGPVRWLAPILLGAVVAFGAVGYFGYSKLELEGPHIGGVVPAVTDSRLDLLEAAAKLVLGDVPGAAAAAIKGVEVRGTVGIRNPSALPVYLSSATHVLVLNGKPVTEPVHLDGGFLGPRKTLEREFTALAPFERLPDAVLAVVVDGGEIEIQVESTLKLLLLKRTVVTDVFRFSVRETSRSVLPS